MDVLAIRNACDFAKQHALAPETAGPMVMEMVTYRYGGHSMSDPGTTYRTREEIQQMRSKNDPITGLKYRILDAEVVTENELKALDKHARAHVDEAVVAAKSSPEPDAAELWTEIYLKGSEPPTCRGLESQEIHKY
jgi:pyruvate dehydrogenase E1 component alpha subunit